MVGLLRTEPHIPLASFSFVLKMPVFWEVLVVPALAEHRTAGSSSDVG